MNNKVQVFGLGEILLRLDTNCQLTNFNHQFQVYYGGAEYNALVILSSLNIKCAMISLVQKSFIGQIILRQLALNKIDDRYVLLEEGNQGLYFSQKYQAKQTINIAYNRQHSLFATKCFKLLDYQFGDVGDYLLISGTSLLTSQIAFESILKIVKQASLKKMKIIFDFNYRQQMAKKSLAKTRYQEILIYADLIFATKKDFVDIFNYDKQLTEQEIFYDVLAKYQIRYLAYTKKIFADSKKFIQGFFYSQSQKITSKFFDSKIVDPIGKGDAFAGGIICKLIKHNFKMLKIEDLNFALSLASYVQTIAGDNAYLSIEELSNFVNANPGTINR